jgi:methionyl-tRNA formyltransferase
MSIPAGPPRLVLFGTRGGFSRIVLEQLLASGIVPAGVVVAAEGAGPAIRPLHPDLSLSPIPLADPFVQRSIVELAWAHRIPAFAVGRLGHPAALAALGQLDASLACAACFPRRIPPALLVLPHHGFLNIHPALLPAHRGPDPIFWTLRAGETATGVTLHWMDAGLDSGPIALQERVELPEGVSYQAAERQLVTAGAGLLIEALGLLGRGELVRRDQAPGGSYEPWPQAEDFTLDAGWPARRAYIFACGLAVRGRPLALRGPGIHVEIEEALSYDPQSTQEALIHQQGEELLIAMQPGVLRVRGRVPRP